MVGFAAGIMLAATVFSLILPAIDAGTISSGSRLGGALIVAVALLAGAALLLAVEHWIPHELLARDNRPVQNPEIRRVWLFVFVMTLHNLPEGLVVGVTFAGENTATALPLAIGIGMQNIPEGLAVALAMLSLNYSPHQAAWVALATGLVEPVGALLGAGAIVMSAGMVPWALAFAAGAMLFVITHEIIPQSHKNGRETSATVALFGGFVIMMLFDTVLA
jgi:ZIP family zinc transporter